MRLWRCIIDAEGIVTRGKQCEMAPFSHDGAPSGPYGCDAAPCRWVEIRPGEWAGQHSERCYVAHGGKLPCKLTLTWQEQEQRAEITDEAG
jgi:hypothetical protein